MPVPIEQSAASIDLSHRFVYSETVGGSPALAAETIIATIVVPTDEVITTGIMLRGWAAFTVGTSGTASQLQIRRTNVAGTSIKASGALTTAAASLQGLSIDGVDETPALTGQTYVLTLQVTAGAAVSTVSAVTFSAFVV